MPITHNDVCYWPIPKCACTSVKTFFAINIQPELEAKQSYDVHAQPQYRAQSFEPSAYNAIDASLHSAGIRDPVKRLISAYVNRVWQKKDLIKRRNLLPEALHYVPEPNTFFRNLAKAQCASRSIRHHTLPQYDFLGPTLERYPIIGQVEELHRYFETLRTAYGFVGADPKRQVSNSARRLSLDELDRPAQVALLDYCEADYILLRDYYQPPVLKSAISTYVRQRLRQTKRSAVRLAKGSVAIALRRGDTPGA